MSMGLWLASGVLGSNKIMPPPHTDPPSRGEKWAIAAILAIFLAVLIALIWVAWFTITTTPDPSSDCCTLSCRTVEHLPECR